MPGRSARSFPRSVCNERKLEDACLLVFKSTREHLQGADKAFLSREHVSWPLVAWQSLRRLAQNWPTEEPPTHFLTVTSFLSSPVWECHFANLLFRLNPFSADY